MVKLEAGAIAALMIRGHSYIMPSTIHFFSKVIPKDIDIYRRKIIFESPFPSKFQKRHRYDFIDYHNKKQKLSITLGDNS